MSVDNIQEFVQHQQQVIFVDQEIYDLTILTINELCYVSTLNIHKLHYYLLEFNKLITTQDLIINIVEFPWFKNGAFSRCKLCNSNECPGHVKEISNIKKKSIDEMVLNHRIIGIFYSYICYTDNEFFNSIHGVFETMLSNHCHYPKPKITLDYFLWHLIQYYNYRVSNNII